MGMRKFRDKVTTPDTILGKDFVINGNIEGAGSIIISGQINGNGCIDGLLELISTAVWEGDIRADDAILGGTVKGDVFVHGRLEITESAKIFGTVTAASVSVAQGALIDGTMKIHNDGGLDEKSDTNSTEVGSTTSSKHAQETLKEATSH